MVNEGKDQQVLQIEKMLNKLKKDTSEQIVKHIQNKARNEKFLEFIQQTALMHKL